MKNTSFPKQRCRAHTNILLRYLAQEGYTTAAILQELFNLKSHRSIYQKIEKWMKNDILEEINFKLPLGSKAAKLYKLTTHAQTLSRGLGCDPRYDVKPSLGSIQHTLFLQQTKIALLYRSFYSFQTEKQIDDAINVFGHYPDLLCLDNNHNRVIVEAEVTLKSKARYQQLMSDFLAAVDSNSLDLIMYVLPDEQTKQSLINAIKSACGRTFERKGLKKSISLEKLKQHIRFYTLSEISVQKEQFIHFQELYNSDKKAIDLCQLHFGAVVDGKKLIVIESLNDHQVFARDFDKKKFGSEILKQANLTGDFEPKDLIICELIADSNSLDDDIKFISSKGKIADKNLKKELIKVVF